MSVKVHIIEDSALKASNISKFLIQEYGFLGNPGVSASFQSGLRAICELRPELTIMDMTLPTFDRVPNSREGRIRPLGGYDLMSKMQHKSIPSSVIVVTQLETFGEGDEEVSFLEITERCRRDFPDIFVGSVYYDQGGVNWQIELATLMSRYLSHHLTGSMEKR